MNSQLITRFLLLTTTMMPLPKSGSPQLGSEADPIRQQLFACQSMEVLVQGLKLDGRPGPFQTFADAVELAKAGEKEEAKTRLHSILTLPNLETRIQLWVWSALRELGEQPNANSGKEVLGVVIEVPVRGAYDTLAGYQDGSARYLNFTGKAIFWDKPDALIKSLCERLITSTIFESSRAVTRKDTVLPKSGTQVTLLMRSGMYVIVEPPQSIVAAGSALMVELMKRVKETETASTYFTKIPAGTTLYIGPPAKRIPQQISNAIGTGPPRKRDLPSEELRMWSSHPCIFSEAYDADY